MSGKRDTDYSEETGKIKMAALEPVHLQHVNPSPARNILKNAEETWKRFKLPFELSVTATETSEMEDECKFALVLAVALKGRKL